MYASYDAYRAKTDREIPVVVLEPAAATQSRGGGEGA
jgi:hypothetical protein